MKELKDICKIENNHFILDCCPTSGLTENPILSDGEIREQYEGFVKRDHINYQRKRFTCAINIEFLHYGQFNFGYGGEPLIVECSICGSIYEVSSDFFYSMKGCGFKPHSI